MPCPHRFYDDLNLSYVTWQPTTLIVGTFNPSWNYDNDAKWFYGRTNNNYFWDVLPRLFNEASLIEKSKVDWIAFCKANSIAITDLISSAKDADESNESHRKLIQSFSDKKLEDNFDLEWNDVSQIISQFPSITSLLFTRRSTTGKIGLRWLTIVTENKNRISKIGTLLTPSPYARFQFTKQERKLNPKWTLQDFIFHDWEKVFHSTAV